MTGKSILLNKQIWLAIGIITFTGAVVVGGTGAFFSDSVDVTGNTFAVGTLDLKLTQNEGGSSPADTQSALWDFTNMAPGGTPETASVWLRNVGSVDGSTLSVNASYSNNGSTPSQVAIAKQMRITEMTLDGNNLLEGGAGARAREYVAPTNCDIEVNFGANDYTRISAAVDAASDGEVICVGAGNYSDAWETNGGGSGFPIQINVDDVTLVSVDGPEQTIIDAGGATNALVIGDLSYSVGGTFPTGVKVQGFTVQNWDERGIAQRNGDGVIFIYDNIVKDAIPGSITRGGIILSGGDGSEVIGNTVGTPTFGDPNWSSAAIMLNGTDNAVISDNIIEGVDIGVAVGGYPDWSSVDPSWVSAENNQVLHNTIINSAEGIGLAGSVSNTDVRLNDFEGNDTAVAMYEDVGGTPAGDNVVNENNFTNYNTGVHNSVTGTTLDATNNWWDGFITNVSGDGSIDTSNFAGGPFTGLVNGADANGNGYADLDDLRLSQITGITPGLDSYDGTNDQEFVLSVQLDGPTTGNDFQGVALENYKVEFSLNQI